MTVNINNLDYKRAKYGSKVTDECQNFLFLKDGSMVFDYDKFDSYWDAMIDAVMNKGENIDRIISLVFREKIDQPIVKKKLLDAIEEEKLKKVGRRVL